MLGGRAGAFRLWAPLLVVFAAGSLVAEAPVLAQMPDRAAEAVGADLPMESEVRPVPENDNLTLVVTGLALLLGASLRRQYLSRRQ